MFKSDINLTHLVQTQDSVLTQIWQETSSTLLQYTSSSSVKAEVDILPNVSQSGRECLCSTYDTIR
jgi:hypothetical protein